VVHSYRPNHSRVRIPQRTYWLAVVAVSIGSAASCSSSGTGSEQATDAGSGDASPMTEASSGDTGGVEASAPADAGGENPDGSDAATACPSYANFQVACSRTCNGNCVGANGVHIGDCYFTATGNVVIYCAPWGAADPCSYCP